MRTDSIGCAVVVVVVVGVGTVDAPRLLFAEDSDLQYLEWTRWGTEQGDDDHDDTALAAHGVDEYSLEEESVRLRYFHCRKKKKS